jgi:hypothetical protein
MGMMTIYTVSPSPSGEEFQVHARGSDGIRQIMLNFKNETEANAWIASDKEHDRIVAQFLVMATLYHV